MYEYISAIKDTETNFTVVIGDIDNFKNVNDTYGHDCGDKILSGVSEMINKFSSENVLTARWGGEEFLLLFMNESADKGIQQTEELMVNIRSKQFLYNNNVINITMTFGATTKSKTNDINEAIIVADKNLYYGKTHGKDQLIIDCMDTNG